MKILYIAVHNYKSELKWRTESFISNAFLNNNVELKKIDYREILKKHNHKKLHEIIKPFLHNTLSLSCNSVN